MNLDQIFEMAKTATTFAPDVFKAIGIIGQIFLIPLIPLGLFCLRRYLRSTDGLRLVTFNSEEAKKLFFSAKNVSASEWTVIPPTFLAKYSDVKGMRNRSIGRLKRKIRNSGALYAVFVEVVDNKFFYHFESDRTNPVGLPDTEFQFEGVTDELALDIFAKCIFLHKFVLEDQSGKYKAKRSVGEGLYIAVVSDFYAAMFFGEFRKDFKLLDAFGHDLLSKIKIDKKKVKYIGEHNLLPILFLGQLMVDYTQEAIRTGRFLTSAPSHHLINVQEAQLLKASFLIEATCAHFKGLLLTMRENYNSCSNVSEYLVSSTGKNTSGLSFEYDRLTFIVNGQVGMQWDLSSNNLPYQSAGTLIVGDNRQQVISKILSELMTDREV